MLQLIFLFFSGTTNLKDSQKEPSPLTTRRAYFRHTNMIAEFETKKSKKICTKLESRSSSRRFNFLSVSFFIILTSYVFSIQIYKNIGGNVDFIINPIKVQELARIVDVSQPAISEKFKDAESSIKGESNRIIGITPKGINDYLLKRGHNNLYRGGVYLSSNFCGGTSKTTSTISLGASARRFSDPEKTPIIWVDYDSQSSLTSVLNGGPIPESRSVLINYFEKRAKLEDILTPIGHKEDNLWLIGSNLSNLFLEKCMSKPIDIKNNMKKLIEDIFSKFGDHAKIFFDSPPALSSSTTSVICAISSLQNKYDTKFLIPLRTDKFSLDGARYFIKEKEGILDGFGLKDTETIVFLSNYDKRVKISVDILRDLLEDPILKEKLCPVMIRYSSEVVKAHYASRSIFNGKKNTATEDYTELALFIFGYKSAIKGNA
jgi:cellulose biosynthesis protein BcsQ